MDEIILQFPTGIAVEFAGWDATDADVGSPFTAGFLAPFDADFGSEACDVFIVFKISPKFNLGAGFLV